MCNCKRSFKFELLGLSREIELSNMSFWARTWESIVSFFSRIKTYFRITWLIIKKKKRGEPLVLKLSEILPKESLFD